MATTATKNDYNKNDFGVDYVITYRYATSDKSKAVAQYEKLLQRLASVGLATEVRQGDDHSLLIFVRVQSQEHLYGEVYRSRVRDWIHGVRTEAPEKETAQALDADPLYEAERLRIIYQLITNSQEEGGAGIVPKDGEWSNVESIFALHDVEFNKQWIKTLSRTYSLDVKSLDEIRNRFGEKIAYYFAFIQAYFRYLIYIAGIGASSWYLLGQCSPIYGLVNALGCIIFTELWKHQEVDLAIRWGVRGVSAIDQKKKEFKHEKEINDPVTGEKVKVFSPLKRLQRQLLQIPFAACVAVLLGCLIATCFGIEVFISEVYDGPFKSVLVFLPTGILTTVMPVLNIILQGLAKRLTDFENYETEGAYKASLTQKLFIMDLFTSYLGIFLTAFVYMPFGKLVVPYLDVFSVTVRPFSASEKEMKIPKKFEINQDRLRKQVIYFTTTAQVVNFMLELIVPYATRKGFAKVKQMQSEYAMKHGGCAPDASENDVPEEAKFLEQVRKEAALPQYDVSTDIREMVIQFGYLSLFSVVWPLTSISFLINNWIELRADAIKICVEMQRPTPWRADTIGPWLDSLSFLTWLGSITTAALVYMFENGKGPQGSPDSIKFWALLLTVFMSEQSFLIVRWGVRTGISKLDSPSRQKERRHRYLVRKRYIDENLSELMKRPAIPDVTAKLDHDSLEEAAREGSLSKSTVENRFWARQRGWRETAQVGSGIIDRTAPSNETKKTM